MSDCPNCGAELEYDSTDTDEGRTYYHCPGCGYEFYQQLRSGIWLAERGGGGAL